MRVDLVVLELPQRSVFQKRSRGQRTRTVHVEWLNLRKRPDSPGCPLEFNLGDRTNKPYGFGLEVPNERLQHGDFNNDA